MALTKDRTFDNLHINNVGQVTVAWRVEWFEDGVLDMQQRREQFLDVADDTSAFPNIVQNVCAAAWTPAVIQNRLAQINLILVEQGLNAENNIEDAKIALALLNQSN